MPAFASPHKGNSDTPMSMVTTTRLSMVVGSSQNTIAILTRRARGAGTLNAHTVIRQPPVHHRHHGTLAGQQKCTPCHPSQAVTPQHSAGRTTPMPVEGVKWPGICGHRTMSVICRGVRLGTDLDMRTANPSGLEAVVGATAWPYQTTGSGREESVLTVMSTRMLLQDTQRFVAVSWSFFSSLSSIFTELISWLHPVTSLLICQHVWAVL